MDNEDKPKKKRVYKKRIPKQEAPLEEPSDESIKTKFCEKVREALDIDFVEATIFNSMKSDSTFIEGKWDSIGKIVLPYVYGGASVEGPQSVIKNSFLIGYFLGSLREKYKEENKKWKNFMEKLI